MLEDHGRLFHWILILKFMVPVVPVAPHLQAMSQVAAACGEAALYLFLAAVHLKEVSEALP